LDSHCSSGKTSPAYHQNGRGTISRQGLQDIHGFDKPFPSITRLIPPRVPGKNNRYTFDKVDYQPRPIRNRDGMVSFYELVKVPGGKTKAIDTQQKQDGYTEHASNQFPGKIDLNNQVND